MLGGSLDDLICGSGSPDSDAAMLTKREIAFLERLRNLPAENRSPLWHCSISRGEL